MPSWLILVLFLAAAVAVVGLQAAGVTGNWRGFRTGARQFGTFVAVLVALALVIAAVVFTLRTL